MAKNVLQATMLYPKSQAFNFFLSFTFLWTTWVSFSCSFFLVYLRSVIRIQCCVIVAVIAADHFTCWTCWTSSMCCGLIAYFFHSEHLFTVRCPGLFLADGIPQPLCCQYVRSVLTLRGANAMEGKIWQQEVDILHYLCPSLPQEKMFGFNK